MDRNCVHCTHYVDCKFRTNGMRKVKRNHGGNQREDIRVRIAMMQMIAEKCENFEKEF